MEEVAGILAVSGGTVKSLLARGRRREGRRPSAAALVERGRRRRLRKVGRQMVRDVAIEPARCRGRRPDEKVLVAWGRAHGQTWLIEAKPPRPGENWLCWASGLFGAGGAGSTGMDGRRSQAGGQATAGPGSDC